MGIVGISGVTNAETLDGMSANELISRTNFLVNPDFRINQRGVESSTTITAPCNMQYLVDRWAISTGDTASGDVEVRFDPVYGSCSVNIINSTDEPVIFCQRIDIRDFSFIYSTLTFSLKDDHLNTYSCTATYLDTAVNGILKEVDTTYGAHMRLCNFDNYLEVQFVVDAGCEATMRFPKLEQGNIVTRFVYPDPILELQKCQRYFYRMSGHGAIAQTFASYGSYCDVTISLPTAMRENPTVTVSDISIIRYSKTTRDDGEIARSLIRQMSDAISPYDKVPLTVIGTFEQYAPYNIFLGNGGYIDFSAEL